MRTSRHWLPTILVLAAALVPPVAGAAPRSYIDHKVPPGSPQLPFGDAVLAGDTLYVAGHLGIDPHTGSAPTDPAAEAHLVMDAVIAPTSSCTTPSTPSTGRIFTAPTTRHGPSSVPTSCCAGRTSKCRAWRPGERSEPT